MKVARLVLVALLVLGVGPAWAQQPPIRVGAFLAVVVAGLAGAAIGFGLVDVGCTGDCGTASGIAALLGGLIAAGGVAIVAVLLLRSMAEWKTGGIRRS